MSKNILKIQNCYSWLISADEDLKKKLWSALRFKTKNYQNTPGYKQRRWDGYTDFFKKETGRFLSGLLPEIQGALKLWKIDYEIQDERNQIEFAYNSITSNFLHQWADISGKKIDLYDYQFDFVNQIIKYKRGIITASPGAGKTNSMISFLKILKPKTPTLILVNRKGLAKQNYDLIEQWGFPDLGRLYDKYNDPNIMTVATVQSIHKIENLLPHIKVLVVDEVHTMTSKTSKKVYAKLKNCCCRLAMSATWEKDGGKDECQRWDVKGYFGPVLKTSSAIAENGLIKTKALQKRGTLSKSLCTFFPVTYPELPYAIYQDAVTQGIANNWDFHNKVAKLVKTLKGRTLVLVERLDHGDFLHSLLPDSFWIAGEDNLNSRQVVIDRLYKSSKEDAIAICTQGIFNDGIDVHLMNLVNCAGGKAEHVIIQRMGRGLRPADDKEMLNYYDFLFKVNPYLEKHSKTRMRILKKEGHEVVLKDSWE